MLVAGACFATDERNLDAVKARLVADHASVAPGETFRLAVVLDIDPGWHVYWKYPGEAGLPTAPKFELPDGYSASELNWPIPIRFMQGPNLPGFGYNNQLLLSTDVTVPKDAQPGDVELRAKVRWLGCSDVCVPGRKEVSLPIKIGANTPSEQALFDEWNSKLPMAEGPQTGIFESNFHVTSETDQGVAGELEIRWHEPAEDIDLYPAPTAPLEVRNLKITTDNNVSRVSFLLFHPQGEDAIKMLDTLLVFKRRGRMVGVSVPIEVSRN